MDTQDRNSFESRWARHLAEQQRRALIVPEWRRRALEQTRRNGFVAVWVTSGQATAL